MKQAELLEDNYFITLNNINVNEHTEKKNGLTYLSWAWAWGELKKVFPTSTYTIYENNDGWNYFTDGKTAWVKTGVTVNGIEHIEYLPIMDFRNKSIPVENITSFDVNKAIQRSLTKAVARHGLGLYVYAGEDLPEEEQQTPAEKAKATREANQANCEKLIESAKNCIEWLKGLNRDLTTEESMRVDTLLNQLSGNKLIDYANQIAQILMDKDKIGG